jgi:hypothetical protein
LTDEIGIEPHTKYLAGEPLRGPCVHERAGWEWRSDLREDAEPLLESLLSLFEPHIDLIALCGEQGAEVSLTIVGSIAGDVVASEEEADWRASSAVKVRSSLHS